MKIDEIKDLLKRKAVIFNTGGKKLTKELNESCIGCVCWQLPNEELPCDDDGKEMLPLVTIFRVTIHTVLRN